MGLFTKDILTLEDLFLHGLQDIYYAEHKIIRALPDLIAHASDAALKRGLKRHLSETNEQVERLERTFHLLGEKPRATKCYGIHGLISEADEVLGNIADQNVLNAAVISCAQAVEHYEITRYGSLIALAREMGRTDIAAVLGESLSEEKAADAKLTEIAEARVNSRAEGGRKLASARTRPSKRARSVARGRPKNDRRSSSRK
jgi:ferritin-like metal-binding protein YciE